MGKVIVGNNEYYTYDDIDKTQANYRIVIGERSNGKTYGFKKKVFDHWLETGKQFAYCRRFAEEILLKRVNNYWNDLHDYIVLKLDEIYGEEEYSGYDIIARTGEWQVCGFKGDKKTILGTIGYYFALNQTHYDKSVSYPEVDCICYEEFLTNKLELNDEFTTFINFISTIKRKRTDMVVYMLGNTVNRNSQILEAMNINIRDLRQGEIKNYVYYSETGVKNTVAIEYCRNYKQDTDSEAYFTFGHQKEKMITRGLWETDDYQLFTLDDFYQKTPKLGIVLDNGMIKLYCYYLDKDKLVISKDRLINRIPYITLTVNNTNQRYRIFNFNNNSNNINRIKNLLIQMNNNGFTYFDSNLTGCDFDQILITNIIN